MNVSKVVTVFRTRLRPGVEQELGEMGVHLAALASSMPGFLSYKDYGAEDGEFVTIVEFDTVEHLAAWRKHPDHMEAQKAGRERLFSWYHIQVCLTEREYSFSHQD
jgi:heme-degrading monooxygenase HmoA